MAQPTPLFVGLDVHKDSISVAFAAVGEQTPPHLLGQIGDASFFASTPCMPRTLALNY
jgi:hypothetical protein